MISLPDNACSSSLIERREPRSCLQSDIHLLIPLLGEGFCCAAAEQIVRKICFAGKPRNVLGKRILPVLGSFDKLGTVFLNI